jgi:hypothetical protein
MHSQSSLSAIVARHVLRVQRGRRVDRDKLARLASVSPLRGSVLTDQTQAQGGGPPSGNPPVRDVWVGE